MASVQPYERLIIVVKAAEAQKSNDQAKTVDRAGGERTFTIGLSPTGEGPPTHYWCSWAMEPGDKVNINKLLDGAAKKKDAYVFDGDARTPESVLAELGLKVVRQVGVI